MKSNKNHLKIVLYVLVNNTAKIIQVGSIGFIDADDRHSHGFYMVEFISSPYNLQENKTIDRKWIDYGGLV